MAGLARYRRGDVVTLSITLPTTPDAAPLASVINSATDEQVALLSMPSTDEERRTFDLDILIGLELSIGTYEATFDAIIDGAAVSISPHNFEVIQGGDSGGSVISIYPFHRPEATYVVAQLAAGYLVQGVNPHIEPEAWPWPF